ncbi:MULTISPECIES: hypothetical protein [Flavobacterium]|uniref:Uncharacterized protein n=1 Tax=Flavobacterium hankyongi TaxID=1176532 RepID=A0ABP8ZKB9_9FLAO|nr:hypothetical protein [Flavobacterium sp. N1846]
MNLSFSSNQKILTHTQIGKKIFEVSHKQYVSGLLDKTLQYEMEVTLLGQAAAGVTGYEIDRKNVLIDKEEPNTVFEILAMECGKALFPLRFSVDEKGNVVTIYEYPKVLERWEIIKSQLLNYYEGDMAVSYIKCNDSNLKNIETLKKMLRNQLFGYFFFNPLIKKNAENKQSVIWKTAPFMDFEGEIQMNNAQENVNTTELILESDSPFIKITAQYTFDEKNKSIDSCKASIVQDNDTKIELSFIAKQAEVSQN